MLLEKLKRHFKFRVVDVISAHEAMNIKEDSADFVISTVPLENCSLEYVVVSVAFNDTDYIRVGNRIDALRNSRALRDRLEDDGISARGLIDKITNIILYLSVFYFSLVLSFAFLSLFLLPAIGE